MKILFYNQSFHKTLFLIGPFILVVGQLAFSQSAQIVPPTPNAMKMTEYYAQRPNMYTGTANVSIPLYTIDFDGWKLPLSISYNATGIRANEEASEVGLGWALNATGIISRTIKCSDDLFKDPSSLGHKGYVYSDDSVGTDLEFPLAQELSGHYPPTGSYYQRLAESFIDTQPDVFNYNFFGYTGSFVLSQQVKNSTIKAIKVTQDACSILFTEANGQTPPFFSIITPDGYRGDFTVVERSTTFSGVGCGLPSDDNTVNDYCWAESFIDIVATQTQGRFRTMSSWYLSKITSPRGQVINFKYDLHPDGSSPYLSNSRSQGESEIGEPSPDQNEYTMVVMQTVQEHVYLDSIISEEVKIGFSMEGREDLRHNTLFTSASQGGAYFPLDHLVVGGNTYYYYLPQRYTGINIHSADPSSTFNKSIVFKQSYFNQQYLDHNSGDQNENELKWLRSRLDRLTIDDQEYNFYYDNGLAGLPVKLTKGIDHFGFYNGQNHNQYLLPPDVVSGFVGSGNYPADTALVAVYQQRSERRVSFDYGRSGLLTKVVYPTRGYTTFSYEPHAYIPDQTLYFREQGPSSIGGGARISTIKEYDFNDSLLLSKTYKYLDDPANSFSNSTGLLMTPLLNRYARLLQASVDSIKPIFNFVYTNYSSIPGNSSAEGKIIGYSKVHEVVTGGGKSYRNTYFFENHSNKVLKFNSAVSGHPNLNGHNYDTRNYNGLGNIVQQSSDSNYYHVPGKIRSMVYATDKDLTFLHYYFYNDIERTFVTPYTTVTTTGISQTGFSDAEADAQTAAFMGKAIQTKKTLAYNSNYLLESESFVNSTNDVMMTQYRRPSDYSQPSSTLQYMLSPIVNIVNPVIETIITKNGSVIVANANQYTQQNNFVNLTSAHTYNTSLGSFSNSTTGSSFSSPYELNVNFSQYHPTTGKLLEYTARDGVTHSFIWGYNNKLPIAHGVGITYSNLNQAYSATAGTPNYEYSLRSYTTTQGKQITTYTHNPLVGPTVITDPNLLKKSFVYDPYGRLQQVIDNDGFTLEQYRYHFRERPPVRILSVSGDLNFGTLTPDMFEPKSIQQVQRCSDNLMTKTFTISNTGEDDLNINSITLPNGFYFPDGPPPSFVVLPGTGTDMIVSFNSAGTNFPYGTYAGDITFSTNQTGGTTSYPVSATYATRDCSVSVSTPVLDFGTVTGIGSPQSFQLTNNGNAPIELQQVLLSWDGTSGYVDPSNSEFTISTPIRSQLTSTPMCILPGQTKSVSVQFSPQGSSHTAPDTKLSFQFFEDGCPIATDLITVKGIYHELIPSTIAIGPSLDFGNFTGASVSKTFTINNTGEVTLKLDGTFQTSDPSLAQYFTMSLPPGLSFPYELGGGSGNPSSKDVTLTYTPPSGVFDVQMSTNITIGNDAQLGSATMSVTGKRYSFAEIDLSVSTLVFDDQFDNQPITISNSLNSNIALQFNSPGLIYNNNPNATLTNFAFEESFTTTSLQPGQSATYYIMRTAGNSVSDETITFNSSATNGNSTVTLHGLTRILSLPNAVPAISSTNISAPEDISISNLGTGPLTISSITTDNPNFTITTPTSFTIQAGQNATVTVKYTALTGDFSLHQANLTFDWDIVSTLQIKGQRISQPIIQPSANQLVFNPAVSGLFSSQQVTISNPGNDNLVITGVTIPNPNASDWSATFGSSFPMTVPPTQSVTMTVVPTVPSPNSNTITIASNKSLGSETVQVSAVTRIINVTSTNIILPTFSSTSTSQTVTVSNSGNYMLTVNSISSNNSMITGSPTNFTLDPGAAQNVTITFTPTAYNFSQQSATLSFDTDATSGASAIAVVGQRTSLKTINLSASSLVYDYTGQEQTITVSNVGNDYLNVTGASYTATQNWSVNVNTANLAPNQSTTMTITRLTNPNPETLNVSVASDKNGGNEVVQVSANTRSIIPSSNFSMPAFTGSSVSQSITIGNSGNQQLTISSITSSNPRFTISPSSNIVVGANGGQQNITVTYIPSAYDFSSQGATLTFSSDATNYSGGTASMMVAGQWTPVRNIQLSSNSLLFDKTGQQQTVTISNSGNDYLNITGYSPSNPQYWSVNLTNATLAPNQSTSMVITRLPAADPGVVNFSVLSNKTGGNEVVQVSANTRNVSLSSVSFPSFTGSSSGQTMTISNQGNYPLTVSGITSDNGKFTISPTSFTVAAGGTQNVTVTYTPMDFTSQSATISVDCDATSGTNYETVSAQRTAVYQWTSSPNSTSTPIQISNHAQTGYIYIYNTGNQPITIYATAPSGFSISSIPSLPTTISGGSSLTISVTATGGYSETTQDMVISDSGSQSYTIRLHKYTQ